MAAAVARERRISPRVSALGNSGMDRARLRPGRSALVLNLSSGGALIETEWRLLPGLRVEVQLGEPAPVHRVAARVLRCHVSLVAREKIRYRGALAFEQHLPFGEVTTHTQR